MASIIKNSKATSSRKVEKLIGIKMVSATTENVISFVYLADTFSKAIFGCKANEVTYAQASEVLPDLLSNNRVTCLVTDMSEDQFEGITLSDY